MAIIESALGEYGVALDGESIETGDIVEIHSPYDGSVVAVVHRAGPAEVESAIASAVDAFETTRRLPSWQRAQILQSISAGITVRRDELARTIALEAGKPIRTARVEVERAAFTFSIAAEEAKRIYGEIVPLDWFPGNDGRVAHVRRVPLGPIAGITPFNFPLNLVAHKVAPALAAGNPIVLRPPSQTPVTSLKLAELVHEAGWPRGGFAVVPCSTDTARPLVEDDRIKLLTFTGSPAVGWRLKTRAGRKRVTLELGGIGYAGQTCISVQRVYVHSALYDDFTRELARRAKALQVGDPLDESTDVGPLIDAGAAERVEEWLDEAVAGGATILAGGEHDGPLWRPTVLANIRDEMRVSCQEVFAPLVALTPFDDVSDAIDAAGRSEFGLQAGLFTNDLRVIDEAFDRIEVGGLMINDVSSFRVDHMPYGGVKSSGSGREGLRYAIEEMTELKLLTLNPRPRA